MPGLGERFRAAREARGLSLSDVSEQIRIRSVYLAAIEEENWSAIGAPVYVRGFLRTYARFLGLDPEGVVATFNSGPSVSSQPAPAAPERISRSAALVHERSQEQGSRGAPLIWAAAVVAVLLVAFVVYNEFTMHRRSAPASVAAVTATPALPSNSPSEAPPPSASPPAGPALDGPKSIALVLSAPSWLRVTVDGNVSMEGTFPAGTSKTFHGKSALVRIGNAGGVEIFVDGKDVGKLGKSGDVAEHAFTL
jgi:cytoskeleton protein RodZ